MVSKIIRTSSGMVVTLPEEMLDALHLAEGEEVSVELDAQGSRIVIAPAALEMDGMDALFAKQVAEFIEEYRPALEALAR